MEAKDTVMNDATKRQFIYIKNKPDSNLRGFLEGEALLCQAKISLKARDKEIATTIKAVLEQGPQHCNQHDKFIDECMACQDTCNENIDWNLLDSLKEVKRAGIREVVEWIRNHWSDRLGYSAFIITKDNWQDKLKEWGVEK